MLISQSFPSKYLKSEDLQGKEIKLTMSHVIDEKLGDDTRPILYFRGVEKGLVLNKTNAFMIKNSYGDDTDDWTGQPIVLFAIMTNDPSGKPVQGLRVRPPTAKEMQPAVKTKVPMNDFPGDRPMPKKRPLGSVDEFASALAPDQFAPDDTYGDDR
jgi:hypothetical protein